MARDIRPFECDGDGEIDGGRRRRSPKFDVGDIFFGKDDVKEYVWDGNLTEEIVRLVERESAMKARRKKIKRGTESFNCSEFLKFFWSFKF